MACVTWCILMPRLQELAGKSWKKQSVFSLSRRPQVQQVYPYQEQDHVVLQQPLFLLFDQPMDLAKAAQF